MLSDKDIGNFFVMMSSIFGHKFKSSYGSAVDNKGSITMTAKIWKKTLNGIPHIKDVMGDLFSPDSPLMDSEEWCPDLREIVQVCKKLSDRRIKRLAHLKEIDEYKKLGNKPRGPLEHRPNKILQEFMDKVEKKKLNNRGKYEKESK